MAARYVCRLMKHMDAAGFDMVTAHAPSDEMLDESILGSLQSGYVQRGQGMLPRQGRGLPWRVLHNLEVDREMLLKQAIADPALEFRHAGTRVAVSPARQADPRAMSA
jgi:hypothetical protein